MTTILTKRGDRPIKSRYHKIVVNGRAVDAHRHIMEQHLGRKLERWEEVHHKDGDPHNNRLSNLEVLTKAEHMNLHRPDFAPQVWTAEMRARHRARFSGPGSTKAKLTQDQAEEIRRRAHAGETNRSLGAEFNICPSCVSDIRNGKSYRAPILTQQAA